MPAPDDLESLLARALRDDAMRGASPQALELIRAAGRELLAQRAAGATPWYARLLGSAVQALEAVLIHDQGAGATPGFRSDAAVRQRVLSGGSPDGPAIEIDLESQRREDGMIVLRGQCAGDSGSAPLRVVVRSPDALDGLEVPCSTDGRFECVAAPGSVDIAISVSGRIIVAGGLDVP